jgi:hypothetical protein
MSEKSNNFNLDKNVNSVEILLSHNKEVLVESFAEEEGLTLNQYINKLIMKDLHRKLKACG